MSWEGLSFVPASLAKASSLLDETAYAARDNSLLRLGQLTLAPRRGEEETSEHRR